jgi:hypothetical protein
MVASWSISSMRLTTSALETILDHRLELVHRPVVAACPTLALSWPQAARRLSSGRLHHFTTMFIIISFGILVKAGENLCVRLMLMSSRLFY